LAQIVREERKTAKEDLNMKLVVLGSSGFPPNDLGQTACYAIPELGLTLDAGSGLCRMVDYLQADQFDVYLSHDHPDHTLGLAYVLDIFWRKMMRDAIARDGKADLGSIFASLRESPPRLRVHLAPEHVQNVQSLLRHFRDHSLIEYVPLKPAEELSLGTTLTSFPVDHVKGVLCFGFRLDGPALPVPSEAEGSAAEGPGGSLAYVTDTYGEPGASYVDQIRASTCCFMTATCRTMRRNSPGRPVMATSHRSLNWLLRPALAVSC
jgi:ribonuclease BN (tRNA processing enzyme)